MQAERKYKKSEILFIDFGNEKVAVSQRQGDFKKQKRVYLYVELQSAPIKNRHYFTAIFTGRLPTLTM